MLVFDVPEPTVTRNYTSADFCICDNGVSSTNSSKTKIKVTGGTTSAIRNTIQKYDLKFKNSTALLGLPKAKKWSLYGPQNDTFGLHDFVAYNLSRAAGDWAPHTIFTEMFININNDPLQYPDNYYGIVVLEEKDKIGPDQINIKDITTPPFDITGGYQLEYTHGENPKNLPAVNVTRTGMPWLIEDPTAKDPLTQAEIDYINTYMNSFEAALFSSKFTDNSTGWRQYANESAFVDWFVLTELVKNPKHSYHGADYIVKDAEKKLAMGPIENVIQGFGQCCGFPIQGYELGGFSNGSSGGSAISPQGWMFDICNDASRCPSPDGDVVFPLADWFVRLMNDTEFASSAAKRYAALRAGPWTDAAVSGIISSVNTQIHFAGIRMMDRYPNLLVATLGAPNSQAAYNEVFSQLQSWLLTRLQWLDTAFPAFPSVPGATAPTNVSPSPAIATTGK